jgi:hypothetical protein
MPAPGEAQKPAPAAAAPAAAPGIGFGFSIGLVSLVNTRFFRFSRPVALALAVGALTLALLVTLGVVVRSQTCQRFQTTLFVPFMQPDSQCERSAPNAGWLSSSLVEQSSGSFGPSSKAFYHEDYTASWQGWMEAMSAIMANRSSVPKPSRDSPFDTPPDVSTIRVGDEVSGAATSRPAQKCVRQTRRRGPPRGSAARPQHLQLHLTRSAHTRRGLPPAQDFQVTGVASQQSLQDRCPYVRQQGEEGRAGDLAWLKELRPSDLPGLEREPYVYMQVGMQAQTPRTSPARAPPWRPAPLPLGSASADAFAPPPPCGGAARARHRASNPQPPRRSTAPPT